MKFIIILQLREFKGRIKNTILEMISCQSPRKSNQSTDLEFR